MPGHSAGAAPDLVTGGSGFRRERVTSTFLSRLLADQILIDTERATQLVFDTKQREARVRLFEFESGVLAARDQQIGQADLTALISSGGGTNDLVRTRQRRLLNVLELALEQPPPNHE